MLIRILYSFSRDEGLPLSKLWRSVSVKFDTPVYSVFLSGIATFLLIFALRDLYLITSLSTMGIYFSYVITLGTAIRAHKKIKENRGCFHLGRFSRGIQVISFFWALFISTIMIVPPVGKSGKDFFIFTIIILLLYYLLFMRRPAEVHRD